MCKLYDTYVRLLENRSCDFRTIALHKLVRVPPLAGQSLVHYGVFLIHSFNVLNHLGSRHNLAFPSFYHVKVKNDTESGCLLFFFDWPELVIRPFSLTVISQLFL